MVLTVLEATIAPDKADRLEQVYKANIHQLDAGIVQTFLIHATREPDRWQIATV